MFRQTAHVTFGPFSSLSTASESLRECNSKHFSSACPHLVLQSWRTSAWSHSRGRRSKGYSSLQVLADKGDLIILSANLQAIVSSPNTFLVVSLIWVCRWCQGTSECSVTTVIVKQRAYRGSPLRCSQKAEGYVRLGFTVKPPCITHLLLVFSLPSGHRVVYQHNDGLLQRDLPRLTHRF